MSWFRRVFGTKDRAPTTQEAIGRLDEILVRLEKRSDFLEVKIKEQLDVAKSNAKTNRRVALAALSRKKRYEKELQSLDHTSSNVEFQREALSNARVQTEIFEAMTAGGRALEAAQNQLSIDDVEATQDKIDEQLQIAEDVRNALSRPLWGMDQDMDDLDDELEQMMLDEELTEVQHASKSSQVPKTDHGLVSPTQLPSVPTHTPERKKVLSKEDEEELAELAGWAQ